MFFKQAQLGLFIKFLWAGLLFGVFAIGLKTIAKIFRKNVFIVNLFTFVFWILFGWVYFCLCVNFNNLSFSGVGLFGMLLGVMVIKISIDFFFDYFLRFIYNEFRNLKRRKENGTIQANKKV